MIRAILYLLGAVLVITALRSVIGFVMRAFGNWVAGAQPPSGTSRQAPPAPAAGELKKDPVCGTFIATTTPFQKTVRGARLYFCSQDCQDRYAG
jgi:YHS domain-containing protein